MHLNDRETEYVMNNLPNVGRSPELYSKFVYPVLGMNTRTLTMRQLYNMELFIHIFKIDRNDVDWYGCSIINNGGPTLYSINCKPLDEIIKLLQTILSYWKLCRESYIYIDQQSIRELLQT